MPARAATAPQRDANGTYLIAASGDLIWFRDSINSGGIPISSDAKLTADIDLGGANWIPIANGNLRYAGKFDGGGHTVSSYTITSNDLTSNGYRSYYAGLFGLIAASGDVRNLTVSGDINVDGGEDWMLYAGGVAGDNLGVISNCENRGAVRASARGVGGASNVGGVAGQNESTIANCLNGGAVTASGSSGNGIYAGGVAGNNLSGAITNCASLGDVTASGSGSNYAGGVAGSNSSNGTITNCASAGAVTASDSGSQNHAGGVAGYNAQTITNCASLGVVTASGSGSNYAGGVAGYNGSNGTITNCGWLVSGDINAGLNAVGDNSGSNPTHVVSLDQTQKNMVVTTVLPKERNITVSLNGRVAAFASYPGTSADMSGYFSVTSTSISPDIASIDNSWPYRLTGIADGRATLTAANVEIKATNFASIGSAVTPGISADLSCAVTVVPPIAVTGVTLSSTELNLTAGSSNTAQLTATVLPAGATNRNVSWSSDNSAVATVDANGLVTAIAAGTATITVTTEEGAFTATCAVTVNGAPTPTPTPSGGSSGGCAAGIGATALLALLPFALRRRKK
ncbi:MAG: Ig-like domain-containing protein [Synergistaceae bacterium]|nr:Ig-like domain-containing protein [Synergistaceae bacterium]